MASVDIINFENKYDYPDNYELQQHRRSSVAVEWHKKCITTASSTVKCAVGRAKAHGIYTQVCCKFERVSRNWERKGELCDRVLDTDTLQDFR